VAVVQFYETVALFEAHDGFEPLSFVSAPARLPDGEQMLPYSALLEEAEATSTVSFEAVPIVIASIAGFPATLDTGGAEPPSIQDLLRLQPDDLALGLQAMSLPLVPVENSPLVKRTLSEVLVNGGTATIGFFLGGPVLMIIGPLGLIAVRALASAAWEGARPEVMKFSGDASAALFDALRDRLGIKRRD
jgi:hypothetical protein